MSNQIEKIKHELETGYRIVKKYGKSVKVRTSAGRAEMLRAKAKALQVKAGKFSWISVEPVHVESNDLAGVMVFDRYKKVNGTYRRDLPF